MSDLDIKEILKLDSEERYELFLSLVAEHREIWILVNDQKEFLKIYSLADDLEFLPVWPEAVFSAPYCDDPEENLVPKSISVPEFFTKWVPGLEKDGLAVGVFPVPEVDVWMSEPGELKAELQDVFDQQAGF